MGKGKFLPLAVALFLSLALMMPLASLAFAAEYDSSGAVAFEFSDSGIQVTEGNNAGYQVDGTGLTLNKEGTYVVSGKCSDGSIAVKKGVTDVTLVLKGLELTSSNTAPIVCAKSSGVTIVAASGTTNALTDAAYNNDDNYPDNENAENAVIKCKDGSQVTICGSGTLNINANGKNGIKSGISTEAEGEAWMAIRDVTLNIAAKVNDAINAEQLLTISSGTITADAVDDGIHCDYVMDIGAAGTDGPTIDITNCNEGLEAATLNVYSGDIAIHSEDDCMNAANSDLSDYAFSLNIAGGTLNMDAVSGDGIDSNGTLTISGGTTVVWSASTADNQPLDVDGVVSITGGTLLAAGGSAGMGVNLSAAQPYVVFDSAAMGGGSDGQPGGQNPPESQKPPEGQNPAEGQNPPGGQNPPEGQGSGQFSPSIASGSTIAVNDSSGNAIYSGTAACDANYVMFSSADLSCGSTYTLCSGGANIASAVAQSSSGTAQKAEGTKGTTQTIAPVLGSKLADSTSKARYRVTKTGTINGSSVKGAEVEYVKPLTSSKVVSIPNTVTINGIKFDVVSIAGNAFKNNKTVTRVRIGSNIRSIGKNGFYGCKKLKSVIIGKKVTNIKGKAFYRCTALKAITIPAKVKRIGKQAFYGCKKLKSITIKTTKLRMKTVGSKAFQGISTKAKVKVPKGKVKVYKKLMKAKGADKASVRR